MPYKSDKQRKFLKANKPEVAEKFDAHAKKKPLRKLKALKTKKKTK